MRKERYVSPCCIRDRPSEIGVTLPPRASVGGITYIGERRSRERGRPQDCISNEVESCDSGWQPFIITHEPAEASGPSKGAFAHPRSGQKHKASSWLWFV